MRNAPLLTLRPARDAPGALKMLLLMLRLPAVVENDRPSKGFGWRDLERHLQHTYEPRAGCNMFNVGEKVPDGRLPRQSPLRIF